MIAPPFIMRACSLTIAAISARLPRLFASRLELAREGEFVAAASRS
jgi:hypothetical protein